jgi:hypothetical protein
MSAVAPSHTPDSNQRATIAHVAPFLTFVGIMALEKIVPLPPEWLYTVRFVVVFAVIAALSRPYLSFRPSVPLASIGIGVAVFAIWVAPDYLFGYRHHWLFENSITGSAASSFPPQVKQNVAFMVLRSLSSAMLVPILEELFWRALADRYGFPEGPFGKVPALGVLDCGGAVRVRARAVLGSRTGGGNNLQLVDRAHPQSGGLHFGAWSYERSAGVLCGDDRPVAILAIT